MILLIINIVVVVVKKKIALRLSYDAKSQYGHIGRDKGASKGRNWSH